MTGKSSTARDTDLGPDRLLKPDDAASHLGITKGSLAQLRYLGTGPDYQRISPRQIRYRLSALERYIESTTESSTLERGARRASA